MKLLQINSVYEIASTGRTSYELEKYLETKGWECYMAYADGTRKEQNGIKMGTLNSHRIHSGLARLFGLQGFFSPFSTYKLLRYIKKVKPDIIQLRNLHSNYISITPLLKYIAKKQIPVVITLHDFWFFTGGCCFPDDYSCSKWKTQCEKCPENKKQALIDMSKFVFKKKRNLLNKLYSLCIVGVSNWACDECVVTESERVQKRVIYNWIDFDKFYPKNGNKSDLFEGDLSNKFIILGVATNWNEIKGLQDFLKLSSVIEEDMHIVLIGNMPSNVKMPHNVTSVSRVTDVAKLAQYYSHADVFVNMSYRETFGKTMAEAMSCGCPVVAYDVTACSEIVGEGCGKTIEVGDVNKVYEEILQIKEKTKDSYYSACMEYTRSHFDYVSNAEQYNQLYKSLVHENSNRISSMQKES